MEGTDVETVAGLCGVLAGAVGASVETAAVGVSVETAAVGAAAVAAVVVVPELSTPPTTTPMISRTANPIQLASCTLGGSDRKRRHQPGPRPRLVSLTGALLPDPLTRSEPHMREVDHLRTSLALPHELASGAALRNRARAFLGCAVVGTLGV
jgi:hypothetical protein